MRKIALDNLARVFLFCMLLGSLLLPASPAQAILPTVSYKGTVTAVDAAGGKLTIQTTTYRDWQGIWQPHAASLEAPTSLENALAEIQVGNHVEAFCTGSVGQCHSYVALGIMKSGTEQELTSIYGQPPSLETDLQGNYRIGYAHTADCSKCGASSCEVAYTQVTVVRQGQVMDSRQLYPGERWVYEGDQRIEVTFNHALTPATQCGAPPIVGPQYFSDFTVHALWTPDTTPPAQITDLTAKPGDYPGDIILTWTAPGDDGNTGTASFYTVRCEISKYPIDSEEDWQVASNVPGEPVPQVAGSKQSMTVTLFPGGHSDQCAIKATDDAGNESKLSNTTSTVTPGNLVTDINFLLEHSPSMILGKEVTLLVIPARTDDWSLGIGNVKAAVKSIKFVYELGEAIKLIEAGLYGHCSLVLIQAVLTEQIVDNWLQMRAQTLWGLHQYEMGDRALLMWDPVASLMPMGVPHLVTGFVEKKTFTDPKTREEDYFYYLEVKHPDHIAKVEPSPAHPYYPIPSGYEYVWWLYIKNEFHHDGDKRCTMGLVSERYKIGGHAYVRIELLERSYPALPVRVANGDDVPQLGTMALFCGTKRVTNSGDLHPADVTLDTYLDTTAGGSIRILQGKGSKINGHERVGETQISVETGSPVDIHLTDLAGNHVGLVYDGSGNAIGLENELPNVDYVYGVDDAPEVLIISNPTAGAYNITIRGTATGTYSETVQIKSWGITYYHNQVLGQPTSPGKEDVTFLNELPAAPTGLTAKMVNGNVSLDWNNSGEGDLAGYYLYRSNPASNGYQMVGLTILTSSAYTDTPNDGHQMHSYYVTAVDTDGNESGHLAPVVVGQRVYLPLALRSY